MTAPTHNTTLNSIDPGTTVGLLALSVADLERSLGFYTEAIGLHILRQGDSTAVLGTRNTPLLVLREQRGAHEWPRDRRSYAGLYHFAILVPTRADLGRWLRNWLQLGYPLPGQGDHLVSEALYLEDPDGHGIEIYRDRPRNEWHWHNGQVRMASDPVDIRGLLQDAEREGRPWDGMPEGTVLGHIHLQVGDIQRARQFYVDTLGFDIVVAMPTALFVSAGGYHHHIGMNVWHSLGAGPAPAGTVRLQFFTVDLPSDEARRAVVDRLQAAGISYREDGNSVVVQDPWDTTVVLRVGEIADAESATQLENSVVR